MGLNGVITMDIRKQLEDFKKIVKAPPIRNPRAEEDRDVSNDDLDMAGFNKLFEEIVDPKIENIAEIRHRWAVIPLTDLKMSKEKALDVAKELYDDMGYIDIKISGDDLVFQLTEM